MLKLINSFSTFGEWTVNRRGLLLRERLINDFNYIDLLLAGALRHFPH